MNLHLDDVALFVRIAALGTLSAAARERNVPVSQVTRALARLEAACAARLMHRNTHGLSLTDEGDAFLAQARRLLDIQAELQADLGGKLGRPSGWVRVSVSAVLAQDVIAPSLPSLYDHYPQLRVDIAADDRIIDMAREGIDVAIRTGTPHSEAVVARRIGQLTRSLYASPAYVERFGMPRHPDELQQHRLVTYSTPASLNEWAWREGRTERHFMAQGHTRVDNTAAMVALVEAGAGISRLTDLVALPRVAQGRLVPVLPGVFSSEPVPMYAVMLRERHRLPKVRACIDHWAEWMARQAATAPLR
ncbi:MAG: LysR substrate-binding domain-containing protein [Caldimonas sp.]|uniref:LysR family transcriptional regulator n=1 Tax=Caldimonas sp. TaxID=2838790 RepID=UPI00391DC25B